MKKIAVVSGKGGSGKTMITTGLFKMLSKTENVTIADLDVECPDAGIYINNKKITDKITTSVFIPSFNKEKCTGCKKCETACNFKAISFFDGVITIFEELCKSCLRCVNVCKTGALTTRKIDYGEISVYDVDGKLFIEGQLRIGDIRTKNLINEVKKLSEKSESTYVLYDSPPGTTCPMVAAVSSVDLVILVAEDSLYGFNDFRLAFSVVREMKLDYWVLINKYVPENSPVMKWCNENDVAVGGFIPFSDKIHSHYSKGNDILELSEVVDCLEKTVSHITGGAL